MAEFEGLSRIGQVALSVGDVEEAVSYYRDRVGLRLLFETGGMAFFDCGGVRLLVGEREADVPVPTGRGGTGTILYFEVADIHGAYDALCDRDVEFVEAPRQVAEMEGTALWLAFFRDPWGNVLALMSEVPA